MGYSNSSLVAYTLLSPNHSGLRTEQIDRISPHCVVGQCTAEGLGDWFHKSSTQASSNYGIDRNGRVGLYVEEKNRSWCTSSNANDQRAVTIECASDKAEPYAMHQVVYDRLVDLCEDICRRNGKKKLLWFGDKNKSLNYQPKADEMLITVHRWFANKSCPGDWLYARLGDLAAKVTSRLGSGNVEVIPSGMQAGEFQGLTEEQVLAKVGPLFTADQKKSGILASVSMAQFILESGYGKSELALGANNCFGMKKSLSGNTWSGSVWDGVSIYKKKTQEQEEDGSYVTVTAEFRKYLNVDDSIADHSASQLGAYTVLDNAKAMAEKHEGYTVYDWNANAVYGAEVDVECDSDIEFSNVDCPFMVKVDIDDLNIRKSAGTNTAKTGKYTGKGVFTIIEVKSGKGSDKGWGRLKSGAGWISLDYCQKI